MKEVVEEVNIFKFIDFSQVNAHGYDVLKMFEAVILAFSIQGYSSLRNLEFVTKIDNADIDAKDKAILESYVNNILKENLRNYIIKTYGDSPDNDSMELSKNITIK